jgi:hypothetical protein
MKRPRGKTVKKAGKPRAAAKKTVDTLPSGKPFLGPTMQSSALLIGNAVVSGGNLIVTGSARSVQGLVVIVHNPGGIVQSQNVMPLNTGAFTCTFNGLGGGYFVTALGIATLGPATGTVIIDSTTV